MVSKIAQLSVQLFSEIIFCFSLKTLDYQLAVAKQFIPIKLNLKWR